MFRFTKKNRQSVLDKNEGFNAKTHYEGKNFRESRNYSINNGKLVVRSSGKTSWADSRFDETYTYSADDEETKRFLRKFRDYLKLDD